MLNQTVLVGRVVDDPKVVETENGKKVSNVILAVPRSYKNAHGEYETDYINCTLWNQIATNTVEYCRKGDMLGVKGRIETSSYEKDGERKYKTNVIAERVTFLSTSQEKTEEKSEDQDSSVMKHYIRFLMI